jgi:peroxin-5
LLNSDNPKFRNSKFVNFLSRLNKGELELDAERNTVREKVPASVEQAADEKWADEFDTSRAQQFDGMERDWAEQFQQEQQMPDWAQEFQQQQGQDWADEFDNIDWKEYVESLQNSKFGDNSDFNYQANRQYRFSEDNPYMEAEDPFTLGLQLMRDGNLSEAVLAFEAVVQKSPDNADAWRYLGQCNQENEDESQAIAALSQAVELDAYSLEALLMLGVSYTNDLEQTAALSHLKAWIENHPDYQVISFQNNSHEAYPSVDNVLDLFQRAAAENPHDVEIQTALGVLFNIANDYEAAISCFRKCVELKPDDASLWNKLGATQANGSRSEEAVDAYQRALELKPNYVRALANLGISFANQGLHEQAAQAYLATLARNPSADHVWNYLKISLSTMDRPELVELANFKDVNVFREFFAF